MSASLFFGLGFFLRLRLRPCALDGSTSSRRFERSSLIMAAITMLGISSLCCADVAHIRTDAMPVSPMQHSFYNYQMMKPQRETLSDDFIGFDDVANNESSTWVCASTTLCYESTHGTTIRPNGCCGANCCYDHDKCCSTSGHCANCSTAGGPSSTAIVGGIAAGIIGCIVLAMCVGVARRVAQQANENNTIQVAIVTIAAPPTSLPSYPIAEATIDRRATQYALTASGENEGDIELDSTSNGNGPFLYGTVVSVCTPPPVPSAGNDEPASA
jgi:hypothetical protein